MRSDPIALQSYLSSIRAAGGGRSMLMADCSTFTLANGLVLRYCDKDVPVTIGANTFLANSVRVGGLRFKCTRGFDVDTQELDIIAQPTDLVGTMPFLVALRAGFG